MGHLPIGRFRPMMHSLLQDKLTNQTMVAPIL